MIPRRILAAWSLLTGWLTGTVPAQTTFEQRLWLTVDAPQAEFERRFRDLEASPDAHWKRAYALLSAGRRWNTAPKAWDELNDPQAFDAWYQERRFDTKRIAVHDVGELPGAWYGVTLPATASNRRPLPVYVDLSWSAAAQRALDHGFAIVRPNALWFGGSSEVTSIPWTAGTMAQSILETIVADLERRFPVDRNHIAIGGFSRMGNVAWYQAFHRPDLWSCVVPASGYFPPDLVESCVENAHATHVLAAWGEDPGHRAANEFTRTMARRLARDGKAHVTMHASKERAIEGGFAEILVDVLERTTRDPLPRKVRFATSDMRHRRCAWAEITAFAGLGRARAMAIQDLSGTVIETIDRYPNRPAILTLEARDDRTLVVDRTRVRSLRVDLSPALFAMDGSLDVILDGRKRSMPVEPSLRTLVEGFRRDRDLHRLFPATLEIR